MQKKSTSTFDERVVLPHVLHDDDLQVAYQQMARDDTREAEALEWADGTCGDATQA